MVLRILLQPCFPAIEIVTLVLPADYPDAVPRQFLQIRIRNRIARADEYNIESCQRKLLEIIVHVLPDYALVIIAAEEAYWLGVIRR